MKIAEPANRKPSISAKSWCCWWRAASHWPVVTCLGVTRTSGAPHCCPSQSAASTLVMQTTTLIVTTYCSAIVTSMCYRNIRRRCQHVSLVLITIVVWLAKIQYKCKCPNFRRRDIV